MIGSKLHSSRSTGEHWVLGQYRQEVSYIIGVVACTDICLLSLAIWGGGGGLLLHVLLKTALYIVKTYSKKIWNLVHVLYQHPPPTFSPVSWPILVLHCFVSYLHVVFLFPSASLPHLLDQRVY